MSYLVPQGIKAQPLAIWEGYSKLTVDRKKADTIYVPPWSEIRCRYRGGNVYLLCGDKAFELSTPVAAKVGYALAQNGGYAMYHCEWVSLNVNGEELVLLPETAIQLGGVMLKKTDRADDWQRSV